MSKTKKKREQAFDLYKQHVGNIELIEIASAFDCSAGTVKSDETGF